MTAAELIGRASITAVWRDLGGVEPKHGRVAAIWRQTGDRNISLSETKGTWFDFVASEGGGLLDLVQRVQNCDRRAALDWLAQHEGVQLDGLEFTPAERQAWRNKRLADEADLVEAAHFSQMVTAMAEHILDELDAANSERAGLTDLLRVVAVEAKVEQYKCPTCGGANCDAHRQPPSKFYREPKDTAGLLATYREWREREPELTAAMIAAGRARDAKVMRDVVTIVDRAEVELAA